MNTKGVYIGGFQGLTVRFRFSGFSYERFDRELAGLGFRSSDADPSLYIRDDKDFSSHLLVYVDDILIVSKTLDRINEIKQSLMGAFDARDLGEANLFLGMTIVRDRPNHTIKLGQQRAITDLLAKYNMSDCKSKSVPIGAGVQLAAGDSDPIDTNTYPYASVVGALLYLSVCTRPDIAFAVGVLSRHMAAPTTAHWAAAKGVLRYLAGTTDICLCFGHSEGVLGYCDSDYAADLDTRRSTTGYVFLMHGGAISWQSRKQPTVAVSTTEAEYMAAASATKEALCLRTLLRDFGYLISPLTILGDNQACIKLLKNKMSSQRSKHIDVMHHFARERVARNEVTFKYERTDKMIADALTKAVPEHKVQFCRAGMGLKV